MLTPGSFDHFHLPPPPPSWKQSKLIKADEVPTDKDQWVAVAAIACDNIDDITSAHWFFAPRPPPSVALPRTQPEYIQTKSEYVCVCALSPGRIVQQSGYYMLGTCFLMNCSISITFTAPCYVCIEVVFNMGFAAANEWMISNLGGDSVWIG